MKAIITVGISASGKTTWAEEFIRTSKEFCYNSNRDDIRFNIILGGERNWSKYKFNKTNENFVTSYQKDAWKMCSEEKFDIIVSDTNLNEQRRNNLKAELETLGYEVEFKFFPITLEEAWKRDALRANGVGKDVIYKQWLQWNETTKRRVYVPNKSLPRAVLVDLDGTLAHMNGRGPFEWDKVGTDTVDPIVLAIVESFIYEHGYTIVFMSGRDALCKEETSDWLEEYELPTENLFMRKEGDMRKDSIVKEELFFTYVADKYNVLAVIDDRPQVVRMWHDIKIPKVISVADQNLEF